MQGNYNGIDTSKILTGTRDEMEATLMDVYLKMVTGVPSDDLLRFHLSQLEVAVSHLTTMALALPRLATIEGNNVAALVRIYVGRMNDVIRESEDGGRAAIAALWPKVSRLLSNICSGRHAAGRLRDGILLAHLAAHALLRIWHESAAGMEPYSPYYCKEEEDFAAAMMFPIRQNTSPAARAQALLQNIEVWLDGGKV